MRNVESRFSENPTNLDISRSRFVRSSSVKTSFNVGDLVPFYIDEVLPGDTFSIDDSKVIRMSTLLAPIMDNLYLDTYYFFVPNRLVWKHWKEFMGENTQSAWIPTVDYSVPQITAPSDGWSVGSLADYFGIPIGVGDLSVNALPFRAYSLICNEWFRDENLTDPIYYDDGDTTLAGSNGDTDDDIPKGGMPFKVAKYHDYFTSCLPAPQKGPDVLLPLGTSAPVYTAAGIDNSKYMSYGMTFRAGANLAAGGYDAGLYTAGSAAGTNSTASLRVGGSDNVVGSNSPALYPINLMADLSEATAATVNQLRLAFQIQKLYEKDARGGTRYIEILKSHFGVTSPDARLQRPEYLGGSRKPINVTQVVQNSESGTTPQGHTAAWSATIDHESAFTKSFVEHGFVIGLMCVRYDHTYQQGIERMWSRKGRFDYYFPVFANIGEQAVFNKEIFAQGTDEDDEVFGYNEAWADYRYKPSRTSGYMRSTAATSLDVWHLGDDYAQLPSLSDSWIREDKNIVDRVLAVTSAVSHQFYGDIFVKNVSVRPMPVYSIPGLIDHH